MDLVTVALPLSLAFIMFSLGVGLTVGDFTRVLSRPLAFGVGAFCQIVLLPLVAFALAKVFGLSGAVAVGFMILSLCPGGVTSNVISKLAKADVALSVSLTAVISLVAMLTVPLLLAWSVAQFEGADAPQVDIAAIAVQMALISTVPILIGMAFRAFATNAAARAEPWIVRIANVLFTLLVIAAIASNWGVFLENLPSLGPALVALCAVMLILGFVVPRMLGLSQFSSKTISVESGIQNAAMGITVAGLLTVGAEGFTAYSIPPAVYGVLMYFVAVPAVLWFRSLSDA